MAVTCRPHDFKMVPTLLAMMPLPMPEMTPPVTRMYFIIVLWFLEGKTIQSNLGKN